MKELPENRNQRQGKYRCLNWDRKLAKVSFSLIPISRETNSDFPRKEMQRVTSYSWSFLKNFEKRRLMNCITFSTVSFRDLDLR